MRSDGSRLRRATALTLRDLARLGGGGYLSPWSCGPHLSNLADFENAWCQSPASIVGFGVSFRQTGGERTEDVCVRVYVRQKRASQHLRSRARIPARAEFGTEMAPVPIDVVEMPECPQLHRSCTAGDGISAGESHGTLGAVVVDALGVKFGLTCAHVVAPSSHRNPFGTAVKVAVPGSQQTEALGTVEAWTLFSAHAANTTDAALIRLRPDLSGDNALGISSAIDDTPIASLDALLSRKPIRIRTRRGEVSGLIDSVKNSVTLGFGNQHFKFTNILAYQASVVPGDSGASVIVGANRFLGLHFAGIGITGPGYCITGRKILQTFSDRQLRLA